MTFCSGAAGQTVGTAVTTKLTGAGAALASKTAVGSTVAKVAVMVGGWTGFGIGVCAPFVMYWIYKRVGKFQQEREKKEA